MRRLFGWEEDLVREFLFSLYITLFLHENVSDCSKWLLIQLKAIL